MTVPLLLAEKSFTMLHKPSPLGVPFKSNPLNFLFPGIPCGLSERVEASPSRLYKSVFIIVVAVVLYHPLSSAFGCESFSSPLFCTFDNRVFQSGALKGKTKRSKEKLPQSKRMGVSGAEREGGESKRQFKVRMKGRGGKKRGVWAKGAGRHGLHRHQFLLSLSCWMGSWSCRGSRRRFRSNSTSAISSFSLLYFSMSKRVLFTPLWKNSRYCLSLASG